MTPLLNHLMFDLSQSAELKESELRQIIRNLSPMVVAYSGGVDSTYLAYAAFQELGSKMLAVLAVSPSLPSLEEERAIRFLQEKEIPSRIVHTDEMADPGYSRNDENRCYFCKRALFQACDQIRQELGWKSISYGFNIDDSGDFRPGHRAAEEFRVCRPLFDVRMTKAEVRERSRELGLPDPDRPATPCLASRLPYSTPVTEGNLRMVELVEDRLHLLGFRECRARFDGATLRIEVPADQIEQAVRSPNREELVRYAKELGAAFISIDLEGFVSGKLNRLLAEGGV